MGEPVPPSLREVSGGEAACEVTEGQDGRGRRTQQLQVTRGPTVGEEQGRGGGGRCVTRAAGAVGMPWGWGSGWPRVSGAGAGGRGEPFGDSEGTRRKGRLESKEPEVLQGGAGSQAGTWPDAARGV